jgi:hypothetical protein
MPASEHLRRLAEALGAFTGGLPPRLDSWDQAIEALFGLGAAGRPALVVLDEFPYMARSASGLPSIIQHALSPRGKAHTGSRTRLILCGSSISFMGQLVSGSAALFGRARLSLMVRAFDFRMAARFWGSRTTCRWRRRCSRWWAGLPLTSSTRPHPVPPRDRLPELVAARSLPAGAGSSPVGGVGGDVQVAGHGADIRGHVPGLAQEFASGVTLGGEPDIVSPGVLNDPAGRSRRKLDIVVRDSRRGLVAIGEAMSGDVIGHGHLSQLCEAVNLLRAQSHLSPACNRCCCSSAVPASRPG